MKFRLHYIYLFSLLIKGFTVCAAGTPSIPYRYLTIVSSNSEKRGFHQTAKRFQYDPVGYNNSLFYLLRTILIYLLQNFTPGPGQYETFQSLDKQLEKTSDSKKGSGSFASKVIHLLFSYC